MKLLWEVGDIFYRPSPWNGSRMVWKVVNVQKNGVTGQNLDGERYFFGKNQIKPSPLTIQNASYLHPNDH